MTSIDDLLDDRVERKNNYPDWWEPSEEGEHLQGLVTERKDNPWADAEDTEPGQMLYVLTDEDEYATRIHKNLSDQIIEDDVRVGDYVRIVFDGKYTTDTGQQGNNYTLAVVRADELEDSDIDVPEADGGAIAPPPRDVSTDTTQSPDSPEVPDVENEEAVEFVESLMGFHEEMDVEKVDKYLNDINDFDITVEEAVSGTDFSIVGDKVTK